jgi:hypothetical protein
MDLANMRANGIRSLGGVPQVRMRGRGQCRCLFDHLVGAAEERQGEGEAERLRRSWIAPSAHRSQLAIGRITGARLLNHLVGANEK